MFEEVTVKAVDQTLDGPLGPVDGGLVVEELHMDGTTEDKTFAPGYGEFYTADGGDVEALALAVPTDALPGPHRPSSMTLDTGALDVFDAAQSKDWTAASATVEKMTAAWETYRAGEVPKLIEPRMTDALAALARAVDARDAAEARQAAIDVAHGASTSSCATGPRPRSTSPASTSGPPSSCSTRRRGTRARSAATSSPSDYIRDRILNTLDDADRSRVNTEVRKLQVAAADEDLAAASDAAERLREILKPLQE